MNYDWIDEYLLSKTGVEKTYKEEWEAYRYKLRDKLVAMSNGDKEGNPIISFKLEPVKGEYLRKEYEDIIPGYYMNKTHWNSMYLKGSVPQEEVRNMCDETYQIAFNALTKKAQKEILELK